MAASPAGIAIPPSSHTVSVSIINSTGYVSGIQPRVFMAPAIPGFDSMHVPCYCFLIKHRPAGSTTDQQETFLFDLGIRSDFESGPPELVERLRKAGFQIEVEKSIAQILEEGGEDLRNINGIIWSHPHFDHTGDPSTFPSSTDLIVGPAFKEKFLPGYPTDAKSGIDERTIRGRALREIDFDTSSLRIGEFRAVDFFADGSFYLLDSPGHAVGHMCALARTGADEFIMMGGDLAHQCGEIRPTQYLPLPEHIVPDPLSELSTQLASNACPGSIFLKIHPEKSPTKPFMRAEGAVHDNAAEAVESAKKWEPFDAQDNIFTVLAHDASLLDVLEFYPKSANEWRRKGWRTKGLWRFLRDFDPSVEVKL